MTRASLIRAVSVLPDGEYRYVLGAIRKARRVHLGKPVRRLRLKVDSRDVRWAQDVRERDRFMCRRCGASQVGGARIEAAHIVPRRYPATRRLLENGVALCHQCHKWAHAHETEFVAWVRDESPEDARALERAVPGWKGCASTQTE